MPTFISASQASRLRKAARKFEKQVSLANSWKARSDDALWRRILSQVVVVGRAEPGHRILHDPEVARRISIKRLAKCRGEMERQKRLHKIFAEIGVRYAGSSWRKDRKAAAAAKNFGIVMDAGGPRKFLESVAACKTEDERIRFLQENLSFYGNKGARDALIDLRLAKNCMALDTRIFAVLGAVGVKASPDQIYEQIERELIQKVATPMGISGALLDRILFQRYDEIKADLQPVRQTGS